MSHASKRTPLRGGSLTWIAGTRLPRLTQRVRKSKMSVRPETFAVRHWFIVGLLLVLFCLSVVALFPSCVR